MEEPIQLQIPPPEYALMKGVHEGLPALWVVNGALARFKHREIFPWCLSVLIEFHETDDKGMPTAEEWQKVDALGENLEQAILGTLTKQGAQNALFLARFTWNGRRQQFYYAHEAEPLEQTLQAAIVRAESECEWEYYMDQDIAWQHAQPYLKLLL